MKMPTHDGSGSVRPDANPDQNGLVLAKRPFTGRIRGNQLIRPGFR